MMVLLLLALEGVRKVERRQTSVWASKAAAASVKVSRWSGGPRASECGDHIRG